MKIFRWLAPALTGLLSAINVQAQTVDEIIDKYIDAVGGKDKISGITSIYKESDIEVMGNTASAVTYILNRKGYKMEMDFNGSKIIQCITDKGGWGMNPMMGQSSAEALPDDQVQASQSQLSVEGPLVDYAAKGSAIELLGTENVNGSNAYKLKVITKDKVEITIYVDASSYYITKMVNKGMVMGQEVETSSAFSNYRKTNYGYVVPFTQELQLPGGIDMVITDKKVEINKAMDPAIFDMPKN